MTSIQSDSKGLAAALIWVTVEGTQLQEKRNSAWHWEEE